MKKFSLETREFIELNRLIKYISWVESGGAANSAIGEGNVTVNGKTELRKRNKLREGDLIEFNGSKCQVVA